MSAPPQDDPALREQLQGEFGKLTASLQAMFQQQEEVLRSHARSVEGLLEQRGGVDESKVKNFLSLALEGRRDQEAQAPLAAAALPAVKQASEAAAPPTKSVSVSEAWASEEAAKEQQSRQEDDPTDPKTPAPRRSTVRLERGFTLGLLEQQTKLESMGPSTAAVFPKAFSVRRKVVNERAAFEMERLKAGLPAFMWPLIGPWVSWWYDLEEPARTTWLAKIVQHRIFDLCCEFVIAVNSVVVAYAVNKEAETLLEEKSDFWWGLDFFFIAFYILEMLLRLTVHRLWFFGNRMAAWNIFDFCLVCFALMDLIVEKSYEGGTVDVRHMRAVRSLRLMRAAKILRMFRLMRVFSELRLLLSSVLNSVFALFWGLVLLLFMLFIFALVFVQGATSARRNPALHDIPLHILAGLEDNWSSTQRAMLVLFACVTGGKDWVDDFEEIQATGFVNANLFIFFLAFGQFAVLNILTSIFVERALKLAEPDRETAALMKRREELQDVQELRSLCRAMDHNGTGLVCEDDFLESIKEEQFKARLALLGLDIKQAKLFADVIFTEFGTKELEIESFVAAAMRLKGLATALDLQALLFGTKMIYQKLTEIAEEEDEELVKLDQLAHTQRSVSKATSRGQ